MNEAILGGRVKTMMCGGASLSEETQRFVQTSLNVTLFQGYGLTETCAAATIGDRLYSLILNIRFILKAVLKRMGYNCWSNRISTRFM